MTTIKKIQIPLTGEEVAIEDFVREVNKRLGSNYKVIYQKEQDRRDLVQAMVQQLHKRITGIEDYLNDWTESQIKSNKMYTDHLAVLDKKITELDQWSNTVIDETNRVINEINAHDPEGTRKYIFGVLDNVVKEINNQKQIIMGLIDEITPPITDKEVDRAINNIEILDAALQKKQQEQPQKKKRGRPKKTGSTSIKLTKNDIKKAKEELAKLEAGQQPQKRGRGRPRKDQQVTKPEPVKNQKKKRGRPRKTENR